MIREQSKRLIFGAASFLLRGKARKCPLCRKSFRTFLSHGIGPIKRSDVKCPKCRSLERHRALWLFFQSKQLFQKPLTLLHCAPEPQLQRLFRELPHIRYITIDYSVPGCDAYVDLTRMGFKSDSFDALICNHVLEHIVDDFAAIAEINRVLKPGGWAILQCPVDYKLSETFEDPAITTDQMRQKMYGHYDHKRQYGADYADRLRRAGLIVEEIPFVQQMPESSVAEYGLDRNEHIYFCRKSQ